MWERVADAENHQSLARLGAAFVAGNPAETLAVAGAALGPSTFCGTLFQIERTAMHSYGPDPHSR